MGTSLLTFTLKSTSTVTMLILCGSSSRGSNQELWDGSQEEEFPGISPNFSSIVKEIPSTDICPQLRQIVWKRPLLLNSTNPPNNRTTEQNNRTTEQKNRTTERQNNRTTERQNNKTIGQQNNSMEAAFVAQLNEPA